MFIGSFIHNKKLAQIGLKHQSGISELVLVNELVTDIIDILSDETEGFSRKCSSV